MSLAIGNAFAAASADVEYHTQQFLDTREAGGGKALEQLSPAEARKGLVDAQAGIKLTLPKAAVSQKTIAADGQKISLTIVRPAGAKGTLPALMFFHGGGSVLGDYSTHERLVHDFVIGSGVVAVFVNYTPSSEADYGVAIN